MSSVTISIMYLILLSSLLHITTCTVYTVTPDDHYYPNTTCHHCDNLQHYLLNVTKYFTSNTQLLILPGLHHLHTDLIIQNVHNISVIGSTGNSCFILFLTVTKLTIKNIKISCSHPPHWVPLTIHGCSFVLLHQIRIYLVGK